jgi:hypothetical protein
VNSPREATPPSGEPQHPSAPGAEPAGEHVWRQERRGRSLVLGPLYRSGYLDAFLVGTLEDGRDIALAAGVHSRHYPFFHPRAKWDDLLLVVGEERLSAVGRNVSSLTLTLGPKRRAVVGFHGRATRPSGALVDVHLHLELEATIYPPRAEGIGLRYALMGLQWQPALVRGSGSVTLHGQRVRVASITGLMERGSLTNVRGRWFHPSLRYLAAARVTDGDPAVYVRFDVQPLARGLAGLPLRLFLRANPVEEELTVAGPRVRSGDLLGLGPGEHEPIEALMRHVVDAGPARVVRELVRVGEGDRRRYAFRHSTAPTVGGGR